MPEDGHDDSDDNDEHDDNDWNVIECMLLINNTIITKIMLRTESITN